MSAAGPAMLDSDILSALIGSDPVVLRRADAYLGRYLQLNVSAMSDFEVRRGLAARPAPAKERRYEEFTQFIEILPLDGEIFRVAAVEYGRLHRLGRLIPDADLLIAATALVHGLTLITNNQDDFARIERLRLDNWLA